MNWSDERYVKLYTRDSLTWLTLGFEARAVLALLLRKVNGAGIMETGTIEAARAVAMQIVAPVDVVRVALAELVELQVVELVPNGVAITNFVEAQEATKTESLKKRDQRQRALDQRRQAQLVETLGASVPACPGLSPIVPLQPSPAHHQLTTSPAQPSPAQPSKKPKKAQAELSDVVPPKAPRELTLVQRLHAFFAEERDAKLIAPVGELKGLGLPEVIPDDPPRWDRLTAAVTAWLALWPGETPEYQELFARGLISAYLDDPHWATATRWDRKGNDTGELQPYPLRVLVSEKVWRPLYEKLERELDGTPAPGGVH